MSYRVIGFHDPELMELVQVIGLKDMAGRERERRGPGVFKQLHFLQDLGALGSTHRPQQSNKLGNGSRLFTNYDAGMRLGGWEQEN
ncbi:hypothetical protein Ddye_014864 [Dipteronia dyeriana]|uniref:Uncharacterized protein n=1 Tax=Dipteronia dyeriana TaxID=168575 RepID=A0AAD9U3P7_9ROSI|nr:hypothetical protein Ddye_014864 [Dipteronia dyeriana]